MKIFNKIKYAYHFIKGKDYLSKKNIVDALKEFNIAKKYNTNDYELFIYKGLAELLFKEFESSLMSYQYALKLVEKNKKLNTDEKNYLKKYILEDILFILNVLNKKDNFDEYLNLFNEIKFDRNKIRSKFFKDFPLDVKD